MHPGRMWALWTVPLVWYPLIFTFIYYLAQPAPKTLSPEYQEAEREMKLRTKSNPLFGTAAEALKEDVNDIKL